MRVLDAGSRHTYKMGKNRKHKIRKSKENEAEESSDEGAVICSHIAKAVNCAAVRKTLLRPTCNFGECANCAVEATKSGAKDLFGSPLEGAAASAIEDSDIEPTIWVCLQCGHQGCDRNSREKHALKHFETPHSGIHCIVANLTTWSAWCYFCDNDIPVESSKRIQECIDFLRKQAGLPRMDFCHFAHPRPSQPSSQSDISPTDPSSPTIQPRLDKPQLTGKSSLAVCQKVKGLSNLGNTCFFNAVMQNLCQTHSLETLLAVGCKKGRTMHVGGIREPHSDSDSSAEGEEEDDGKLKELALIEIVLGDAGPLTQSLLNFTQEMNSGGAHCTVTPNTLFSHVCKKAPRFKGFQQQDSHELLRYLVDVVRNEEIKRAQSGILKYFKLSENTNPKKVDEGTKAKVKEYGRQVKYTFLDRLFGGQLVSTVTCEECKHISQIFEPFLDLSLPVTEEKPQRPNQTQSGRRKDSLSTAVPDAHEDAVLLKGVDGFAERESISRRQERKVKRQAKKDAKRKYRVSSRKESGSQGRNADEDKDCAGDEEEHASEVTGDKDSAIHQRRERSSGDMDEENSSPQEDPSDADVEDNLENETSKLQIIANDYGSNLAANACTPGHVRFSASNLSVHNHCDSEGEAACSDIKIATVKENHILPAESQLADLQPTSLDSVRTGIKEEQNREIEKLVNGINNLEVDHLDPDKVHGAQNRCGKSDFSHVKTGGELLVNHFDSKGAGDLSVSGEFQESIFGPTKKEGETGRESILECDNGLEKDLEDKLCISGSATIAGCGSLSHVDKNLVIPKHMGKSLSDVCREAKYKAKTILAPRYQPMPKECSVMSCLHQFTAAELLTGSNKVSCKVCARLRPKNSTPHKDKKGCDTVYTNAAKQFLIMIPPAILTLHLKRFEQVGYMSRKVNRHVDFPLMLDLAPYCSSLCQDVKRGQHKVLYSLYGVVEHSGRLQTGHYTAYVKVRPSIGPVTSFIHSHSPNPLDYIHRYMEQIHNGPTVLEDDGSDELSVETLVPPGRWFHVSDSRINEVTEATVLKAQAYLLFYERVY